jgi:signal transduction histidine kinase
LSPLLLERSLKKFVPGTDFSDRIHPNTNRAWLDLWRQHDYARSLYEKARPFLKQRDLFWFGSGSEMWLGRILPETQADGRLTVSCREESEVRRAISAIVSDYGKIPDYFGIALTVADRTLATPHSDLRLWKEELYATKSGGQGRKRLLSDSYIAAIASNAPIASLLASTVHSEGGADLVKLDVYLTSPDTLFKRQTTQSFWFGSLIGASAAVALAGLLAAWRAFHAQQQLSEMKSNFVSSVSHELRAPIASVRLLAESLEKGKIHEPAKQVEYFRFIGQECRRLSGLIQNVLDFSRIEQGRKQYEFEPTDILALVKETAGLMRTYAEEREVRLRLNLDASVGDAQSLELCVDGRAIQQALVNLIDNAIKHSPRGAEVVVVVGAPSEEQKGEVRAENGDEWGCRIWVEDKGPGIPANEQTRIFERFYRVGSELRRETQGVGIGLSIVKHVVEAHGGKVTVKSVPGQGSTFAIELPRKIPKLE